MKQRGQDNYGITLYGMYRCYKKKFRGADRKSKSNIDYWTYAKVIRAFNEKLAGAMINECFELKMPYRLGRIRIKKFKIILKLDENGNLDGRKLPVNWKRSKELWKRLYPDKSWDEILDIPHKQVVYHINEHSDGYQCMLYWNKISVNVTNNRVYSVDFYKVNKRKLAKALFTNHSLNFYE